MEPVPQLEDRMSQPEYDLIAVGEILVDLLSEQMAQTLEEAEQFHRFVGGEVANVAWNVSLLGGRAALVGCVGADGFGRFLRRELERTGVDTSYIQEVEAPTTISVMVRHTTTPDFIIYRGADALLSPEGIPAEAIACTRALHTSAFGLSREPSRSAVFHALKLARKHNCLVSLDPNYHPSIWEGDESPLEVLRRAYAFVDITKPSWDDCQRLFGPHVTPGESLSRFLDWGAKLVALTMGREGVLLALESGERWKVAPHNVPVSDVTGAGDAFWAGLLMALLDGLSPRQAAEVGQVIAERKLGTFGPLREKVDRKEIYRQLWGGFPVKNIR